MRGIYYILLVVGDRLEFPTIATILMLNWWFDLGSSVIPRFFCEFMGSLFSILVEADGLDLSITCHHGSLPCEEPLIYQKQKDNEYWSGIDGW